MATFRACRIITKGPGSILGISAIWSKEVCEQILDLWVNRYGRSREDYELDEGDYILPDDEKEVIEEIDLHLAVMLREVITMERRFQEAR